MKRNRMNVAVTVLLGWWLLLSGPGWALCAGGNENSAVISTTPTTDFVVHGNGTVTHTPTGLMWKRCSEGQSWDGSTCTGMASFFTWQEALNHANTAPTFAGHNDWRLPNRKELASLVERRCWSPSINTVLFPQTPPFRFWSSSPSADGSAWDVRFLNGRVRDFLAKSNVSRARLVRAGQ